MVWLKFEIKWENDPVNLPSSKLIDRESVLTRSHRLGIKKETFKLKNLNDCCKQLSTIHSCFYNRLAPTWDVLHEIIVKAPTIFKAIHLKLGGDSDTISLWNLDN